MRRSMDPGRLLAPLAVIVLAFSAAACADEGVVSPQLEPVAAAESQVDAAAPATFQVVLLGQGHGPNSAASLGEAMEKVAAGGRILVFPGTYETSALVIRKPVSFAGKGSGPAVIAIVPPPEGAEHSGIEVLDVAGTVSFRDLTIDNRAFPGVIAIFAIGSETLDVEGVDFVMGGAGYGIAALGTDASVRGSSFADCGSYCVFSRGAGTTLTVEDVDAVNCGAGACVFAERGVVATVRDNRLSNAAPARFGDFFHHVIGFHLGTTGEIAGNVIDGCGSGQCIALSDGSSASITGNDITAYGDQRTRFGIILSDGAAGDADDPARGSTATILDNRVIGVGSNPAAGGFAVGCDERFCGLVALEGHSSAEITGNELANGTVGIWLRTSSTFTGGPNDISNVGREIAHD